MADVKVGDRVRTRWGTGAVTRLWPADGEVPPLAQVRYDPGQYRYKHSPEQPVTWSGPVAEVELLPRAEQEASRG